MATIFLHRDIVLLTGRILTLPCPIASQSYSILRCILASPTTHALFLSSPIISSLCLVCVTSQVRGIHSLHHFNRGDSVLPMSENNSHQCTKRTRSLAPSVSSLILEGGSVSSDGVGVAAPRKCAGCSADLASLSLLRDC